jgi:hypothetical protein
MMSTKKSFLIVFVLIFILLIPGMAWAQGGGAIIRIGQDITISEGEVYDAIIGIGNNVNISGTINDAIVIVGGDLEIEGSIGDALVLVGSDAHLKSSFRGDVVAVGSKVILAPGVIVNGDIVSVGSQILKGENALITGDQVEVNANNIISSFHIWGPTFLAIILGLILLASLIFALLTFLAGALFPTGIERSKTYLRNNLGQCFLVGLILFIFFLPLNFILLITLIGIPLIPMLWLIYGVLAIWGISVLANIIGSKILNAFNYQGNSHLLPLFIGILIFYLLALIPILGWLIILIIKIIALGTALLTQLGLRKIDEATD